jgi:soluble lytic murein transglycosylase-like protein
LAAALASAAVLSINLGVRAAGASVSLWSTQRLSDRTRALMLLAAHAPTCRATPEDVEAALRDAAQRHGLSFRLLRALARTESDFVHTRISHAGAMGLMQLMPATARELGVSDPFDVQQGADGGARYLKQLLRQYRGDVRRALAAYNAGPARVPRRGPLVSLPLETQVYVSRVMSRM